MKNSLKVAFWEIKRNLKNKTFIISLVLTPVFMIVFGLLPGLLQRIDTGREITVYIVDDIGIYDRLIEKPFDENIKLVLYEGDIDVLEEKVLREDDTSFIVFYEGILEQGIVPLYTAGDGIPHLGSLQINISEVFEEIKLEEYGLSPGQITDLRQDYIFTTVSVDGREDDWAARVVPAVFAGFILIAVSVTGIMTFQSAVSDKKDKMAEILLSSVTPTNLMQGKILGYFALGLLQAFVLLVMAVPIAQFHFEIPVFSHLFTPVLPIMLFYALIGYLMYSALFVSFGATVDDIQEAGNFHSILFILPWLPLFFIGPIISSPSGTVAMVASYFPFTSPGIMLFRLAFLSTIPVTDILISAVVLILTTWGISHLAGKIFKTGMLMYGKNATPKEIWRWVRK